MLRLRMFRNERAEVRELIEILGKVAYQLIDAIDAATRKGVSHKRIMETIEDDLVQLPEKIRGLGRNATGRFEG